MPNDGEFVIASYDEKAILNGIDMNGKLSCGKKLCKPTIKQTYYHLYIISDEPIVESDWYIKDNKIHQKLYYKTVIPSDARKIIATTDTSVVIKEYTGVIDESNEVKEYYLHNLPTPSPEFISAYIAAYNKGEQIKEVMVEYEDYLNEDLALSGSFTNYRLKVYNQNCITIRKRQSSFTEKEMHENMQYYMEYCQIKGYVTPMDWLEKYKHF